MKNHFKILVAIWVSAIATFAFTAAYIVPQDQRINAPGELGEVFAVSGLILIAVLVVVSAIGIIVTRNGKK